MIETNFPPKGELEQEALILNNVLEKLKVYLSEACANKYEVSAEFEVSASGKIKFKIDTRSKGK